MLILKSVRKDKVFASRKGLEKVRPGLTFPKKGLNATCGLPFPMRNY